MLSRSRASKLESFRMQQSEYVDTHANFKLAQQVNFLEPCTTGPVQLTDCSAV